MLITLKEAAQLAGVSESYLRRLCRQGKLQAQKFGFTWVLDKSEIDKIKKR